MNEYMIQYPDMLVDLLSNDLYFESNNYCSSLLSHIIYIKKNILQLYFRDIHLRMVEIMYELYPSYSDKNQNYDDYDMNIAVNMYLPYSDTNVNRSFWIPIKSWEYRNEILEYQVKKILNIT